MSKHDDDTCPHLVRASLLEAANARLKAEVEELKRQPDPLTAYLYAAELAKDAMKKLEAENTYLKAEVERLTAEVNYRKNMDTHIKIMADQYTPVKEGKPSV